MKVCFQIGFEISGTIENTALMSLKLKIDIIIVFFFFNKTQLM